MSRSIYNYRNRPQTGPESAGSDLKLYIRQPIGFSDFPKEVSISAKDYKELEAHGPFFHFPHS